MCWCGDGGGGGGGAVVVAGGLAGGGGGGGEGTKGVSELPWHCQYMNCHSRH